MSAFGGRDFQTCRFCQEITCDIYTFFLADRHRPPYILFHRYDFYNFYKFLKKKIDGGKCLV